MGWRVSRREGERKQTLERERMGERKARNREKERKGGRDGEERMV